MLLTTAAYVQNIIKSTTAAQLNNVYTCVADSVVGDSLTDTDHFQLLVDAVSAAISATNAATSATASASSATSSAVSLHLLLHKHQMLQALPQLLLLLLPLPQVQLLR